MACACSEVLKLNVTNVNDEQRAVKSFAIVFQLLTLTRTLYSKRCILFIIHSNLLIARIFSIKAY